MPRQDWQVASGRVEFFPSPDGMVRCVAFNADDKWLCEFWCRTDLFRGGADIAFLEERVQSASALSRPPLRLES